MAETAAHRARLVAPVCSLEEARALHQAGVDEFYCGVLTADWTKRFSDADLLTRRQGNAAHVTDRNELARLAAWSEKTGVPLALALNARYSRDQHESVLALSRFWADIGGSAVLVSDLGVLLALTEHRDRLRLHLSTLAGVFNEASASYFASLGVDRIVLPRDLRPSEIRDLVAISPALEYEALIMFQRCRFIDGACFFHHAVRLPDGVPAMFDYDTETIPGMPIVWSHDPFYEGHGCQLEYSTFHGRFHPRSLDDPDAPECGACFLTRLRQSGIGFFKLAGRGFPLSAIVRAVRFLRAALDWPGYEPISVDTIQGLYREHFGESCRRRQCYYRDDEPWG